VSPDSPMLVDVSSVITFLEQAGWPSGEINALMYRAGGCPARALMSVAEMTPHGPTIILMGGNLSPSNVVGDYTRVDPAYPNRLLVNAIAFGTKQAPVKTLRLLQDLWRSSSCPPEVLLACFRGVTAAGEIPIFEMRRSDQSPSGPIDKQLGGDALQHISQMLASRQCVELQTLCSAPTCLAAELLLRDKFFGLHCDFGEIIEKASQRTPGHDGLHFVASRHEPNRFGAVLDGLHFRMGAGPAKAFDAPAVMTSALALLRKSTATGSSVAPVDLDAKPLPLQRSAADLSAGWQCVACTFLNTSTNGKCEMCEAPCRASSGRSLDLTAPAAPPAASSSFGGGGGRGGGPSLGLPAQK
jgi:hypothetical protein